jgi:NTP pyrophosphatase (non-canonical NTP hydrolase)
MNFNEYQEEVIKLKVYDPIYKIVYPALKLAGEAGEVSEKIGKVLRDSNGEFSEHIRHEIIKELGDVLWYIAALADDLGYDFEDVVKANLDKLNSRKERDLLHGEGDNR